MAFLMDIRFVVSIYIINFTHRQSLKHFIIPAKLGFIQRSSKWVSFDYTFSAGSVLSVRIPFVSITHHYGLLPSIVLRLALPLPLRCL